MLYKLHGEHRSVWSVPLSDVEPNVAPEIVGVLISAIELRDQKSRTTAGAAD